MKKIVNWKSIPVGLLILLIAHLSYSQTILHEGKWSKKRYSISGSYKIIEDGNGDRYLILSEDFKTKSGPDLKIFLTKRDLEDTNGDNATDGSVKITDLETTRAGQRFLIPEGIDLTEFRTVLIHCEKFSVLWAGAPL